MNTTLSIKTTDSSAPRAYDIALGKDILEGKTQEEVLAMATRQAKVDLQNNTKLALRSLESIEEMEKALRETYPDVVVTPHASKPKVNAIDKMSNADIVALLKKRGMKDDDILEMIGEVE